MIYFFVALMALALVLAGVAIGWALTGLALVRNVTRRFRRMTPREQAIFMMVFRKSNDLDTLPTSHTSHTSHDGPGGAWL